MRKDFALACECELRVNVYLSNSYGLVVFTGFTSGRGWWEGVGGEKSHRKVKCKMCVEIKGVHEKQRARL